MSDPHAGQPVLSAGRDPREARLTLIMLHGRGAAATDAINRARSFWIDDVAYLAPQAADRAWYPLSFLAPLEQNEPQLSAALAVVDRLITGLEAQGVERRRIGLYGFSQGACLALEYAARHAQRYAAVLALSGGVIGPPGTARDYPGDFDGTPVFLGCSDIDTHIPLDRVHESAALFTRMGATVDERIYPGMGHVINEDEIAAIHAILSAG